MLAMIGPPVVLDMFIRHTPSNPAGGGLRLSRRPWRLVPADAECGRRRPQIRPIQDKAYHPCVPNCKGILVKPEVSRRISGATGLGRDSYLVPIHRGKGFPQRSVRERIFARTAEAKSNPEAPNTSKGTSLHDHIGFFAFSALRRVENGQQCRRANWR